MNHLCIIIVIGDMPGLGKIQSSWLGITAGPQMVGVPEIKWVKAGGEHNSGVSGDWSTERRALVSDRSEERSIALLGMKLTRA